MVLGLLPAAVMASGVSIVIADSSRMVAIRETASLPGRVMSFTSGNLGSAMESVRAYRPKVVAIDAIFSQTPSGTAFTDRVEQLAIPGSTILLLVEKEGRWVTMPRSGAGSVTQLRSAGTATSPQLVTPSNQAVAAVSSGLAPAAHPEVSTRRAPRFRVRGPLDVIVESGSAHLVDMSVLGAQVVSRPALRPGQKIKIGLPDADDTLNVVAQVAWSMFEKTQLQPEPHYRVGLEFSGTAQHVLEQYRRRHCADQPMPSRGR